jgi:hypothetical protein
MIETTPCRRENTEFVLWLSVKKVFCRNRSLTRSQRIYYPVLTPIPVKRTYSVVTHTKENCSVKSPLLFTYIYKNIVSMARNVSSWKQWIRSEIRISFLSFFQLHSKASTLQVLRRGLGGSYLPVKLQYPADSINVSCQCNSYLVSNKLVGSSVQRTHKEEHNEPVELITYRK